MYLPFWSVRTKNIFSRCQKRLISRPAGSGYFSNLANYKEDLNYLKLITNPGVVVRGVVSARIDLCLFPRDGSTQVFLLT